jgi:glycosyltransferase involved in cell wall biosynthesis
MEGVPWELHEWSLEAELAALARFDIGLMPLPNETWALGKSGGKARTYMAAGVVPVVAGIGYNRQLVEQGETGFLCGEEAEWETTLERLVGDAGLRQRIAEAARAVIAERFSPNGQARKIADLLRHHAAIREKQ